MRIRYSIIPFLFILISLISKGEKSFLDGVPSGLISGSTTICSGQSTNLIISVTGSGLIHGTLSDGTIFSGYQPEIIVSVSPASTTNYTLTALNDENGAANPENLSGSALVEVEPENQVSITIAALPNPVCPSSPVMLHATAVNEGTYPVYQWKVNGISVGSNLPDFTFFPENGDEVYCVLTSNNAICTIGSPATSNTESIEIDPQLQVGITITHNQSTICQGNTVIFSAIAGNAGIFPVYQWKVNSINTGTNAPVFAYKPDDGDVVTCTVISDLDCATGNPAVSNPLIMTVHAIVPVLATISTSQNNACEGTLVTFYSTTTNCGANPQYQWKVNGFNAGTNSDIFTCIPLDGDIITCIITSGALCVSGSPVTSNSIVMTVKPWLPVSISITESSNNICQGATVVFNSLVQNAGASPVLNWMVNGINAGTNSPAFVYTPAAGDLISCLVTSGYQCATGNPAISNTISMAVNPLMHVGITIAEDLNNVCEGTAVSFSASVNNAGSLPIYQWRINGINTGTNSPAFSYSPSDGDVVSCELLSSLTCTSNNPAFSNSVVITVNQILTPGVQIIADQNNTCSGMIVNFTATALNAGITPSYQWQVNGLNMGSDAPLRRSLILITSGATGGYCQPADQPRSWLNSLIILILNPFRISNSNSA